MKINGGGGSSRTGRRSITRRKRRRGEGGGRYAGGGSAITTSPDEGSARAHLPSGVVPRNRARKEPSGSGRICPRPDLLATRILWRARLFPPLLTFALLVAGEAGADELAVRFGAGPALAAAASLELSGEEFAAAIFSV